MRGLVKSLGWIERSSHHCLPHLKPASAPVRLAAQSKA